MAGDPSIALACPGISDGCTPPLQHNVCFLCTAMRGQLLVILCLLLRVPLASRGCSAVVATYRHEALLTNTQPTAGSISLIRALP